ncbi:MAG: hypothetical protein K0V04_35255 [Deltaproteobacteria bacterium]|nr:hypothetical protein [Deltaproteobacteria bacterium]
MKVVKIILWSLLAALVLSMVGAFIYFQTKAPEGQVVVLAPGEPVTISVDGGPEVTLSERGRHAAWIGVGQHTVRILGDAPRELTFEVTHRRTTIVPVADPQCYATLDVARSAYDMGGAAHPPRLVRTHETAKPFELTRGHYTSMANIPERRTSGTSVLLLRSASCDDIAQLKTTP